MENNIILDHKPHVYEGPEDFVLVSYSHKDKNCVYADIWTMEKAGVRVWYDDGLLAGQQWNVAVEEHMKMDNCKMVLVYLSGSYLDSDATRQELAMIKQYRKNYFAINIGSNSINDLLAASLGKGAIVLRDISLISEIFDETVIYVGRGQKADDLTHMDSVLHNLLSYGFQVNVEIIKEMKQTQKVLILYKNSSFSNSIVSGISDYLAQKDNIVIEKHPIDKSLDRGAANLELYSKLNSTKSMYDGFIIRPSDKYDDRLKNLIKEIMDLGKKVVLLDIDLEESQKADFPIKPTYIGSDFKAGGRAIGERISEIARKFGVSETRILVFGGPYSNNSAKIRCDALLKTLHEELGSDHILYKYTLSTLVSTEAIKTVREAAEEWCAAQSLDEKNVILYCGNDNVAMEVMRVMARKSDSDIIYKALKKCRKVIYIGYDGIRDVYNEIILKSHNLDYMTVDVVPFKQGIDGGIAMEALLFDSQPVKVGLTKPELIESVRFPIEKYDNIEEIGYLFNNKKVIIFDLDGTIADTESLHWKAYNELLKLFGKVLKNSDIARYIGHSEKYIYQMIKEDFNIDFDDEDFLERRILKYLDLVEETGLKPYPFIDEILQKYSEQCDFVLVTSQIPPVVNRLLTKWGYDGYFPRENRFCCHDGTYKKAEIYENIGKYVKSDFPLNASHVLLLEDSNHYMLEAMNMGINVIGVEHKYNVNALTSCDAILTRHTAKGVFVGLCGMDIVYYGMSALPENNTKKKISNFSTAVGGPAANAALTYALLGGEAYLYTFIGDTDMGQILKNILKKNNVKVIDLSTDADFSCNVSTIYINTGNGDRTIISGQSNRRFKITKHADLERDIKNCKFVLYDGNLYGTEKEMVQYIEHYSKDLVIDAGSHKEGFRDCFMAGATVISSENYTNEKGEDIFEQAKGLSLQDCAKTRGDRSIQYLEGDEMKEIGIPGVDAIDTLGAGDVLHGAYCFFRYAKKLAFAAALEKAARFASLSVQKKGVLEGVLYAKEVMIDDIM